MKNFIALLTVTALMMFGAVFAETTLTVQGALSQFPLQGEASGPVGIVGAELGFSVSDHRDVTFGVQTALDSNLFDTLVGVRQGILQEDGASAYLALRAGGQFEAFALPDSWFGSLSLGVTNDISERLMAVVEFGARAVTDFTDYEFFPLVRAGVGIRF